MKLHWVKVSDDAYTAEAPDGSSLDLRPDRDYGGWHLSSQMPEHAGVGYLGDDLHSAMHLTAAMVGAEHEVDGWNVDDAPVVDLARGPDPPDDPPVSSGTRTWRDRMFRRRIGKTDRCE